MSIKIYDAYRMDDMSVAELHGLLQYLKDICHTRLIRKINTETVRASSELIDDCRIMAKRPDIGKILYDDFEKYLTELYKESRSPTACDRNEILHLLREYKHLNVVGLMKNLTIKKASNKDDLIHGMTNTIVLFPLNGKILFQVFGSQITKLMSDILTDEKSCDILETLRYKHNIEDYHYQNQTDRPENITDEAWNRRLTDWKTAMPSHIPARDGTVITLTTEKTVVNNIDLNTISLIDLKSLQKLIPSVSERTHRKAKQLVQTKAIQTYEDRTHISHILYLTSDSILSKHGKYYDEYLQFKSELKTCITTITPDDLQKQVTNFYPIDIN